jgi:hypothetical protein
VAAPPVHRLPVEAAGVLVIGLTGQLGGVPAGVG